MRARTVISTAIITGWLGWGVMMAGCAKHADFMQIRDQLSTISKTQDQDHQRVDAVVRRLEAIERSKDSKDTDVTKSRFDDVTARIQKLEGRLAKLEETAGQSSAKMDSSSEPRAAKAVKSTPPVEAVVTASGITPTSAFNLAYNDYLSGKYELSVAGFQRFIKDFPGTSLTPNAQYWLGESYYNLKDYGRAIQTFDYLVAEYPGNEKMPAALYKLGLATAEAGDLARSRKNLKRVLEEFPTSDESKLAKHKLAELR
ncbi:MAG: tol-pal system protein YbgF [Nitrospira sp.]|nr:tol-pal system protein YbgF [Nitrospira sp.]MBS0155279.1 tol-pal system protein YbgF [Nitrospira sp.]MBS0167145.1 tol-pal system protein YbgF [Nitrospira sp.]